MKTGINGINLIKSSESLHDGDLSLIGLQPKMDPVGIWTEGWGNAMRDENGNFIKGKENKALAMSRITIHTEQEADNRLLMALEPRERLIMTKIKIPLNQNQFDALISNVYNTGGSDTLFNLINKKAGEDKIRNWWEKHYITSEGKTLKGLIIRRKKESDLYFS